MAAFFVLVLVVTLAGPLGRERWRVFSASIISAGIVGLVVGAVGLIAAVTADDSGGGSSAQGSGEPAAILNGRPIPATGSGPRFCGMARTPAGDETSICANSIEGFNRQIPSGYRVDGLSLRLADDTGSGSDDAPGFLVVMGGAAVAASGGVMLRRRREPAPSSLGSLGDVQPPRLTTISVYSGAGAIGTELPAVTLSAPLMFGAPIPNGPIRGVAAYCGRATAAEVEGVPLEGRVAIIERGEDTFEAKASRVSSGGAVAVLMIDDDESDDLMEASAEGSPIPMCAISLRDRSPLLSTLRTNDTSFDPADPTTWSTLESTSIKLNAGLRDEAGGVTRTWARS